jgi:multiple sugar transport system substrate-binding protein
VAPEPGAPVLRGMTWSHSRGLDPMLATSADWHAETGVEITWEARSLLDFGNFPLDELAGRFDLMVIDHPHIGSAIDAGLLVALDDHLDAAYLEDQAASSVGPSHESYRQDGHQWALAVDAAAQVSSGRPDLLERLGRAWPTTWDDVSDLAGERLGERSCVALPLASADALCTFLSLAANRGRPACVDPEVLLPPDVGIELLTRLGELAAKVHPSSIGANPIATYDRMAAGDEIAYVPLGFGYTNYSRPGRERTVLFADVPSAGLGPVGSILGGCGLAVSALGEHVEEAVAYARHVASGPVQRDAYVRAGGQPGHRGAWLDPEANALTGSFFSRTLETLDRSYLRPRRPGWIDFQIEAGDVIVDALRTGRAPAETFAELERRYRSSLPSA